ncbi:DTW domain-containing protein [Paraglaciecola aquimarina]|uniref:tRNA-uridine aminocarboxypropyltransferase n=1 Tax=Paraglaciecola algarum TaxID=3050085 RepID=A0ABS9D452_9ALTE|nr:tRNA-uridine aminocarboxypropyltransferase [Paraglaciecola sp. G1-23]MCF2947222.1 DTW domain-containing protein [Paraglaciecola sp. G1-23]
MQNILDTKRKICKRCEYPASTCVCKWVSPIRSPIKIVILQHPKETKHAKNSVKLLKLGLQNLEVVIGESAQDFIQFTNQVKLNPEQYCLCYPSDKSVPLDSVNTAIKNYSFNTIIFIDASWRKALKMWHLNPWLHELDSWHFDYPPASQYQIRSTSQTNGLSTLESVVYVLKRTQNMDCTYLKRLFMNMQKVNFINNQN